MPCIGATRELRVHGDHIGRGRNIDDGREVRQRVVGVLGLMAGLVAMVESVEMPRL